MDGLICGEEKRIGLSGQRLTNVTCGSVCKLGRFPLSSQESYKEFKLFLSFLGSNNNHFNLLHSFFIFKKQK